MLQVRPIAVKVFPADSSCEELQEAYSEQKIVQQYYEYFARTIVNAIDENGGGWSGNPDMANIVRRFTKNATLALKAADSYRQQMVKKQCAKTPRW